jgi:hypothetical protein
MPSKIRTQLQISLQNLLALLAVAVTLQPARSTSLLTLLVLRQLRRNRAIPAVHARLQELLLLGAVLVVHERLLDRDRHDVEDVCGLLEDQVHFFEGPVAGLGEEEVDGGEDEGVDDGEDDVGLLMKSVVATYSVRRRSLITYLVADGLEGDGRDHHDHEVEDLQY